MNATFTGISIAAFISWIVCMFMGEWKSALFAAAVIVGDVALNTYLEIRREKKSKGQP